MTFLIVIFTLAVAVSALFVLFWARGSIETRTDHQITSREPVSLFEPPSSEEEPDDQDRQRRLLIERARGGELSTLNEAAQCGDPALYGEVLDALLDAREGRDEFAELASYISRSEGLRSSSRLARRAIDRWKDSSAERSTAQMLHVVALSDDAESYQQALDEVLEGWHRGKIGISAEDLKQLVESQFWVLSPEARRSGAGFQLKRRLAGFRRELAAASAAR